jgi:hypothetical protein
MLTSATCRDGFVKCLLSVIGAERDLMKILIVHEEFTPASRVSALDDRRTVAKRIQGIEDNVEQLDVGGYDFGFSAVGATDSHPG